MRSTHECLLSIFVMCLAWPATTPFLLDVVVFVDAISISNIGTLQSMSIEHTYTCSGPSKLVTDEVWLDKCAEKPHFKRAYPCFFVLKLCRTMAAVHQNATTPKQTKNMN